MSESSAPASCPEGHDNTVKMLSMVAVNTGAAGSDGASMGGGGCCGGGCGCG